jgi:hypothetical protein
MGEYSLPPRRFSTNKKTMTNETTNTGIYEPTMMLRINKGVLEQKWCCVTIGETRWMKVPEIAADNSQNKK